MFGDELAGAVERIVAAAFVDAVRERLPGIAERMGAEGLGEEEELALAAAAWMADGIGAACPTVAGADVARVMVAVAAELTEMGLPHPVDLVAAVLLLAADLVGGASGVAA